MGVVLAGGGTVALAAPSAGAGHAANQARAAARHDGGAVAAGGIISTVAGASAGRARHGDLLPASTRR